MEIFAKILNDWKLLTIFAIRSILVVWLDSEYASGLELCVCNVRPRAVRVPIYTTSNNKTHSLYEIIHYIRILSNILLVTEWMDPLLSNFKMRSTNVSGSDAEYGRMSSLISFNNFRSIASSCLCWSRVWLSGGGLNHKLIIELNKTQHGNLSRSSTCHMKLVYCYPR